MPVLITSPQGCRLYAVAPSDEKASLLVDVVHIPALARSRRRATPDGKALPKGPYGQALLLLARKGLRRRRTWTAREFRRFVIRRHPDTSRALAALTRLYELDRFGGGAPPQVRTLGQRALVELRATLASSSV